MKKYSATCFESYSFVLGHSRVVLCLCAKISVDAKHSSCENEFRLQVHFRRKQTYSHDKGFERILVLRQRHKVTQKLPI